MAQSRRQLDPAVEAMVNDRIQPNECVKHWNEYSPGEISVFLIDREMQRRREPIVKKFGRGGGCGRALRFKLQDGVWVFAGEGGWRS